MADPVVGNDRNSDFQSSAREMPDVSFTSSDDTTTYGNSTENLVQPSYASEEEKESRLQESTQKKSVKGDHPTPPKHTDTSSIHSQVEGDESATSPIAATLNAVTRFESVTAHRGQPKADEDHYSKFEKKAVETVRNLGKDSLGVVSYLDKLEKTIHDLEAQLNKAGGTTDIREIKDEETERTSITGQDEYIVDIEWKKTFRGRIDDEDKDLIPGGKKTPRNKYVLTIYRQYSPLDRYETIEYYLEIKSEAILRVLRELVKYYPGISLEGTTITIEEPYCLLFHYQRELTEYLGRESVDEVTKQHLELILTFMKDRTGSSFEEIEKFLNPEDTKIISFKHSWIAFPPGSIVYSSLATEPRAYIVERVRAIRSKYTIESWDLRCWFIDYDGTKFGKVYTSLSLHSYDGLKKVTDLEITPADYLPKSKNHSMKERLIKRGQKFWDFQGFHHQDYTGDKWVKTSSDVKPTVTSKWYVL